MPGRSTAPVIVTFLEALLIMILSPGLKYGSWLKSPFLVARKRSYDFFVPFVETMVISLLEEYGVKL